MKESTHASEAAAAWQPLPFASPADLHAAFKAGAKFVLHYYDRTYPVERMEARQHVVYVQPLGMAVKLRADGSSAEGNKPGEGIWLRLDSSSPESSAGQDEQSAGEALTRPEGRASALTGVDPDEVAAAAAAHAEKTYENGEWRFRVDGLTQLIRDLAERANEAEPPWPEWASDILKTVREHSGYDGYDDHDGVDLATEVSECLAELAKTAESMATIGPAAVQAGWRGETPVAEFVCARLASPTLPASPAPEIAAAGPQLRAMACRLLEQLAANRPRRALDLEAARRLLEAIAQPTDAERLIKELIRNAWEWGASCEVDGVRWGEAGDSHNQMWRDKTTGAATSLRASLLAARPSASQTPPLDQGGAPALLAQVQQQAGETAKLFKMTEAQAAALRTLQEMWDDLDKSNFCAGNDKSKAHHMRRYSAALATLEALAGQAPLQSLG